MRGVWFIFFVLLLVAIAPPPPTPGMGGGTPEEPADEPTNDSPEQTQDVESTDLPDAPLDPNEYVVEEDAQAQQQEEVQQAQPPEIENVEDAQTASEEASLGMAAMLSALAMVLLFIGGAVWWLLRQKRTFAPSTKELAEQASHEMEHSAGREETAEDPVQMHSDVDAYLADCKRRGMAKSDVGLAMIKVGYDIDDVEQLLNEY